MSATASGRPQHCPLCDKAAEYYGMAEDQSRMFEVSCKRCGQFRFSDQASEILGQRRDQRHLLSTVCRCWPGPDLPKILSTNVDSLIQRAPRFTVGERLDRLLEMLAQETTQFGSWGGPDWENDYTLLALRNSYEAGFLLTTLEERGFIKRKAMAAMITAEGWEKLEQIHVSGRASRFAFIAMWFNTMTDDLYSGAIVPATKKAGYEPLRIDRHEHVNRIDDEIIGQIRRSRFMVADFTGQRHGVYFEAGLMMGLGRNVIWMCKRDELDDGGVHFDIRQYNFIAWESVEDARVRLLNRILAIEGEGPGADHN